MLGFKSIGELEIGNKDRTDFRNSAVSEDVLRHLNKQPPAVFKLREVLVFAEHRKSLVSGTVDVDEYVDRKKPSAVFKCGRGLERAEIIVRMRRTIFGREY